MLMKGTYRGLLSLSALALLSLIWQCSALKWSLSGTSAELVDLEIDQSAQGAFVRSRLSLFPSYYWFIALSHLFVFSCDNGTSIDASRFPDATRALRDQQVVLPRAEHQQLPLSDAAAQADLAILDMRAPTDQLVSTLAQSALLADQHPRPLDQPSAHRSGPNL